MSDIISVSAEPLDLPLTEPFEIALGTQHEASNVLVTVETADGVTGYGEGSPIPPVTGETQAAAIETVRTAGELIEGRPVEAYRELISKVRSTFPGMVSALFAVETAILDAYCRGEHLPLAALFGGPPRPVETDLTIPILEPDAAAARASMASAEGFKHLKLKTGSEVQADVERTVAVAEAAPDAVLKIDANQGWTPKETAQYAADVADRGVFLSLIEQPVPKTDLTGLARTRERLDIPVAADEAVFSPDDAVDVVRKDAADIVNVKLGKSGLLGAAEIAAIASAANLELMVGCMLESAIGIHTSAHFVSGIGTVDYVDLDGNRLLKRDFVEQTGPIHELSGPGHGITPTEGYP